MTEENKSLWDKTKGLFKFQGNSLSNVANVSIPMGWDYYIDKDTFIEFYIKTIYKKILQYLFHKTIFDNNMDKKLNVFQDNFLNTEQNLGFISLLTDAIYRCESQVFRYDSGTNTIEKFSYRDGINANDRHICVVDFSKNKSGILLLSQYVNMLYNLLTSEQKKANISNSLTFKINDLTDKVGMIEKKSVEQQALNIKNSILRGDMAVIDAGSSIDIGNTDITPETKTEETIKQNIAQVIGLPLNFLFGTSTAGIGASGENDTDSLERAMQTNFEIYWKPYVEKLFNIKIKYKVENWQLIRNCRDILDYVETSTLLSEEQKQTIVNDILESIGYGK
jgi:hypothetical protein